MPIDLNHYRPLLMGLMDGELTHEEAANVNGALVRSSELREEYERLCQTGNHLQPMSFLEPGDEVTRKLWKSPHHHFARVGGLWLVLLGYVGLIGYTIVEMLSADGLAFPNLCFIGILIGTAILLLSFIQGRIAKHTVDPYKDIQR
ncbi:hypothetical protein OAV21_04665 [bacterium]|jgi:hypothetical protein|nr:hypothetical protein [Verrucomicrobiales bacterium]MDC3255662.1 hypothetical protein [bacterium]MDF1784613.1 hypothetical protein [Verrucomicrobiales bacterium]